MKHNAASVKHCRFEEEFAKSGESHSQRKSKTREDIFIKTKPVGFLFIFFNPGERKITGKNWKTKTNGYFIFVKSKVNKSLPETNSNIRTLSISVASQPQVLQSQAETPEQELLGQSTKSCSCWVGRNRAWGIWTVWMSLFQILFLIYYYSLLNCCKLGESFLTQCDRHQFGKLFLNHSSQSRNSRTFSNAG